MSYKQTLCALIVTFLAACSSVPMEDPTKSTTAKQFNPPSEGNAGLYIYRNSPVGGALKKDIWIDGKCVGETAPYVFFYEEVPGDKTYKVSTESEFSPNDLMVNVKEGMLYFIRQYIKIGLLVGGAGLEIIEAEQGKKDVSELEMAVKGNCSK